MTGKSKEKELVNNWILNELAILQQDYFYHLEKKEINFATSKLIKFARERLSNEYLELIKISPWNTNTKNTLLFVYQELLIMLHPAVPFVTDYIYQDLTQEKILEAKIETINIKEKKNQGLWQIDCLLLLISSIRSFQKKNKVSEFYLELVPEWENKQNLSFDFNQYLEPLVKSKLSILKEKKEEFSSFLDLQPFGVLWYHEQIDKKELEKQLKLYEAECQRSQQLLANINFLQKAPPQLVAEEKKKLVYYQEQKKKVQTELGKKN